MLTIINLFLFILLLLSALLVRQVLKQKQQLAVLQEEATKLKLLFHGDDRAENNDEIRMLIAVEVTNAFELAKRESKMARYVVNVVPDLIKDIVYKQVVENMKAELAREGVDHNISIIYR